MSKTGYNYCTDLVKQNDEDRYLSALFSPNEKRLSLFAIYAFAFEVAQTRERVREPMLGEIRLQWWREAIEGLYAGAPRRHEVVDALAVTVELDSLPRAYFDALIDAHGTDLENQPIASEQDLLKYAHATSSSVMNLAAMILTEGEARENLKRAAHSAGVAWALTGLLRALPIHAARGQCYIPQETLSACDISVGELSTGAWSAGAKKAFREMIALAQSWLDVARQDLKQAPDAALPAFLPLSLCAAYLRVMSRSGFDPFHQSTEITLLGRQFRMIKAMVAGRY